MKTICLVILSLALLIINPKIFAQEQEENRPEPTEGEFFYYTISEIENATWGSLIARYGCPVGLRSFNREAIFRPDGTLLPGQNMLIVLEHPLCDLEYSGEIFFLEWHNLPQDFSIYLNDYWVGIDQIAVEFNVCTEAIQAINPGLAYLWEDSLWDGTLSFRYTPYLRIPVDSPECFEEFKREGRIRDLAQRLNVCEQVIWYYNQHQYSQRNTTISVPLERRACYDDGRLLVDTSILPRYDDEAYYVEVETMHLGSAHDLKDFAIQHHYCVEDLYRLNAFAEDSSSSQYEAFLEDVLVNDLVFVPSDAQNCLYVAESMKSVIEISQEYNVCLETLSAVNHGINKADWDDLTTWDVIRREGDPHMPDDYWDGIFVPQNQSPCYDENGLRIGHNDRAVYETSRDDWLFKIAQEHAVCIEDLLVNNELLRNYPMTRLPALIFIPDVPACDDVQADGMVHHVADSTARYPDYHATINVLTLSYIFNICINSIEEANPNLALTEWVNYPYDSEILIPARKRPCYDYYIDMPQFGHYTFSRYSVIYPINYITYICYAEEIEPRANYTGHEPVISPVSYQEYGDSAYCYDISANPYVVVDNISYAIYPMGIENGFLLADCFGVDPHEVRSFSSHEDFGIRYGQWWAYLAFPNPSLDCPYIGTNLQEVWDWQRIYRERIVPGELNDEGIYTVKDNDTLSAIGWRYGYLPEWIRAENNLPDTMIYPGQHLRLPSYPNLYQVAQWLLMPLAGIIVVGLSLLILRRRRRRLNEKAKNTARQEATKDSVSI